MTNPTPGSQPPVPPQPAGQPSYGAPAQPPYGVPGQPPQAAPAQPQYPAYNAQTQYGAPQYPYAQPIAPMNVMAIISLVLGIMGLAIIPVVLGHVALSQIKSRGERGRGMAIAGLILGYVAIALYVVAAIILVITIGVAATYY